jgi:hypothetical protein
MFITQTITKKILENLIAKNFSNLGNLISSKLLDSLKLLGFYYATTSGLSINIEDLRIPEIKHKILKTTLKQQKITENLCKNGELSNIENSQSIMNNWNVASNLLKDKIIYYYKNFDPFNSLYIMAFSGARGNISQVRQLIGMRGLMSDQEGNIINLPIKTNFREGLSIIDYLISSYGARKGIVDTALKTANSGYLTRRLIYVVQDIVIRDTDCLTENGLAVLLTNKTKINSNLLGRYYLGFKTFNGLQTKLFRKEGLITSTFLDSLIPYFPLLLVIRSSLTCKSSKTICQKCYGSDLAQQKLIGLGEAVGIIAAQSIGEPGTQLTMRTFHTGGVFTNELADEIKSPSSGTITILNQINKCYSRTNFGEIIFTTAEPFNLNIFNWKGKKTILNLKKNTEIYLKNLKYILKGHSLAKEAEKNITLEIRKLKPLYTTFSGEINLKKIKLYSYKGLNFVIKEGILQITAGIKFELPKTLKYNFIKILKKEQPFGLLKLTTPLAGIIQIKNNIISLVSKDKNITINLSLLQKKLPNYLILIVFNSKNYQFIDSYSTIAYIYLYPYCKSDLLAIKLKKLKTKTTALFITKLDCININSDQLNKLNFSNYLKPANKIFKSTIYNYNTTNLLITKLGFNFNFQKNISIFLKKGTLLKIKKNNIISKLKNFATILYYIQQNEDIVQGLPKIENLIDATTPKNSCLLATKPSILLIKSENTLETKKVTNIITKHKISYNLNTVEFPIILNSYKTKKNYIYYNNILYEYEYLASLFKPILIISNIKKFYSFVKKNKFNRLEKYKNLKWEKINNEKLLNNLNLKTWRKTTFKSFKFLKLNKLACYNNAKKELIIEYNKFNYIYLKPVSIIQSLETKLLKKSTNLIKVGNYIDLAEPITYGTINLTILLETLVNYHKFFAGFKGNLIGLIKFQLILINSIQAIYDSQNIQIALKHIEIIVRQMTGKAKITSSGHTPFLLGESISVELAQEIYLVLKETKLTQLNSKYYKLFTLAPLIYSITNATLTKDGFLAAAGFQGTQKILTKAAIEGTTDWLRGLKESIIVNRYIPAGTTFLNYKNYLDNIYSFKL